METLHLGVASGSQSVVLLWYHIKYFASCVPLPPSTFRSKSSQLGDSRGLMSCSPMWSSPQRPHPLTGAEISQFLHVYSPLKRLCPKSNLFWVGFFVAVTCCFFHQPENLSSPSLTCQFKAALISSLSLREQIKQLCATSLQHLYNILAHTSQSSPCFLTTLLSLSAQKIFGMF